jgi:hypothetical protein
MSMYSPYGFGSIPYALTRRKVFISYFHGDRAWAQHFVNTFGSANGVFIPKALGLDFAGADRINSRDPDYVMDRIREKCIDDSSVQIVLVGPCTHSRRYIDWEIKRSLRSGNGLLGIHLPPANPVYLQNALRPTGPKMVRDMHDFYRIRVGRRICADRSKKPTKLGHLANIFGKMLMTRGATTKNARCVVLPIRFAAVS